MNRIFVIIGSIFLCFGIPLAYGYSNIVSYPVQRTSGNTTLETITLQQGVMFLVKGPTYNQSQITQQWQNSSGSSIGWINDNGKLSVSGAILSGGVELVTFTGADARYVNVAGDTMTGALTVKATLSGASLVIPGTTTLRGVAYTWPQFDGSASGKVLKTSGAGQLSWSADTDTGLVFADASSYFVNDSGDSMTGALLVQVKANGAAATADVGVVLEVVGAFSGATIFGQAGLATSGSLTVAGDVLLNEERDAGNAVFTFGSDGTDETLTWLNLADRFEFSDDVRATGNIEGSGGLIIDGATILKSTIKLNGVTYTFPYSDGTASGKVLKTDSAGKLSWSADTNTTYTAGQGLTLTSTTFSQSAISSGSHLVLTTALSNSGTFVNDGLVKFKGDLTINSDATAADMVLSFNTETLKFLNAQDRFEFSDDLSVTGNLTASGTFKSDGSITTEGDLTLNEDQTAANTVLTFGSDSVNETLTFLNAADRFEFSDDLNVTGAYTGSGDAIIYGKILSKNSGGASGTLVINGGAISATPGDHITVRPEGAGLFRAPKDITWSDDADTADATGSGNVFAIPDSMSGGILVDWAGNVATAGVTGTATWQIINQTDGCDLFSTKITIDTAEKSTNTAAAAAVINTACNTFTTDDILILRTDVVQTTAAKGKAIRITIAPK